MVFLQLYTENSSIDIISSSIFVSYVTNGPQPSPPSPLNKLPNFKVNTISAYLNSLDDLLYHGCHLL